jgi:hypothetical protein
MNEKPVSARPAADTSFTLKSYPKSVLALLYFPDSTPHVALNHLSQWIKGCPELVEALARCHQSRFAKYYSKEAVRIITHFLGEP